MYWWCQLCSRLHMCSRIAVQQTKRCCHACQMLISNIWEFSVGRVLRGGKNSDRNLNHSSYGNCRASLRIHLSAYNFFQLHRWSMLLNSQRMSYLDPPEVSGEESASHPTLILACQNEVLHIFEIFSKERMLRIIIVFNFKFALSNRLYFVFNA